MNQPPEVQYIYIYIYIYTHTWVVLISSKPNQKRTFFFFFFFNWIVLWIKKKVWEMMYQECWILGYVEWHICLLMLSYSILGWSENFLSAPYILYINRSVNKFIVSVIHIYNRNWNQNFKCDIDASTIINLKHYLKTRKLREIKF